VGAIFRTADGAGVSKIYLCGYTPAPLDRFGRPRQELIKTSLGATESVKWEAVENIEILIARLKNENVKIVAVEQHKNAIAYTHYQVAGKRAFIFGNEIDGISEEVINLSDACISIPMYGKKESLNVSTAAGIILFHAREANIQ